MSSSFQSMATASHPNPVILRPVLGVASFSAMHRNRGFLVVAVLAAIALTGAACSSNSSEKEHVAKIGVVAPLDGGLTQFGRGIRNSVQLAVDEANKRKPVAGWTFAVD